MFLKERGQYGDWFEKLNYVLQITHYANPENGSILKSLIALIVISYIISRDKYLNPDNSSEEPDSSDHVLEGFIDQTCQLINFPKINGEYDINLFSEFYLYISYLWKTNSGYYKSRFCII